MDSGIGIRGEVREGGESGGEIQAGAAGSGKGVRRDSDTDGTDETSPRTAASPDSAGVSSASDPATGPPGPRSEPDPRGNTCKGRQTLFRLSELRVSRWAIRLGPLEERGVGVAGKPAGEPLCSPNAF
jgi:hypothetical protein